MAAVEPAAEIVARLRREYAAAVADGRRPNPWLEKSEAKRSTAA